MHNRNFTAQMYLFALVKSQKLSGVRSQDSGVRSQDGWAKFTEKLRYKASIFMEKKLSIFGVFWNGKNVRCAQC
ncbi:MAG: hypothetical protein AAGJ08_26830 [Cyanobacteria bacterium P01_H01_bin.35]